ncbi:MAG: hypothetical protein ACON4N_12720, partial [Myxococcota bacterium]
MGNQREPVNAASSAPSTDIGGPVDEMAQTLMPGRAALTDEEAAALMAGAPGEQAGRAPATLHALSGGSGGGGFSSPMMGGAAMDGMGPQPSDMAYASLVDQELSEEESAWVNQGLWENTNQRADGAQVEEEEQAQTGTNAEEEQNTENKDGSGGGDGGGGGGGSSGNGAAAKESARAAAEDPRSPTARVIGCLIGTVRVAATRSQGGGNGVECLAPAHKPGAGLLVRVAVGAPRAEATVGNAAVVHYASAGSRAWSTSTFEAPTVFIGAGRARPLALGAPSPPPQALLKLLRASTESFGGRMPPPPLECYAGAGGRVAEARRVAGRPNEVECWPPAPGGGDARGAGFVPVALVWAEGLGDRHAWGGHGTGTAMHSSQVAIDARRETEVSSAAPHSVASGSAANRPLRLRGVDLPAEKTGTSAVCVYGGGGGTTSFESAAAIVVSSALIICGPVDGQALDAVASDGGGAALAVEAGWAGAGPSATSQSGLLLRVESVSGLAVEAASAIPVEPNVAPASGGTLVEFPVMAGGGTLPSATAIEDVSTGSTGGTPSGG